MGWVGSANNMKWVGLGVNLMGWVGLIKMDHVHVCYKLFVLLPSLDWYRIRRIGCIGDITADNKHVSSSEYRRVGSSVHMSRRSA